MDGEKIAAVIVTLNKIETHGKENLTRLLGCIRTLEEILAEVKKETAE